MIVTKADIVSILLSMGITRGDCAIAHSSLSRFGYVEGGAETVIEALREVLGDDGTLVMPTLCQKDKERRFETWNILTSPSDVGKITEVFRRRSDALRSDHPTHSVAAVGPLAVKMIEGHRTASGRPGPWGEAAFGMGSPWEKLYEVNAKIILMGVDLEVNTMVHFIEHVVVKRALDRVPVDRRRVLEDRLQQWCKPGVWPWFNRLKLQEKIDPMGLMVRGQCGNAQLMTVSAKPLVDHALKMMESAPAEWFEEAFCRWYDEVRSLSQSA